MDPSKTKTVDFIREIFSKSSTVSYRELCRKVESNRSNLIDLPKDYKHKIRHVLDHLKKQKEITSIDRGLYKKV